MNDRTALAIEPAQERAAIRLPLPAALLDPAFIRCVTEAIATPELVSNFNRLYGAQLGVGSPIERMVDNACGKDTDDMRAFLDFVHRSIYTRLPDQAISDLRAGEIGRGTAQEPGRS